jgi:hypothetical protein
MSKGLLEDNQQTRQHRFITTTSNNIHVKINFIIFLHSILIEDNDKLRVKISIFMNDYLNTKHFHLFS